MLFLFGLKSDLVFLYFNYIQKPVYAAANQALIKIFEQLIDKQLLLGV